jgi:hypothetical protein
VIIHHFSAGNLACGSVTGKNAAPGWPEVTCKRCLKHRPRDVAPYTDPILREWEQLVEPPTLALLQEWRRDVNALWMLDALSDHERSLENIGALTAEEDAEWDGLAVDAPKLRDLIGAALKRDAERNL